jgi:hypothetical protein
MGNEFFLVLLNPRLLLGSTLVISPFSDTIPTTHPTEIYT